MAQLVNTVSPEDVDAGSVDAELVQRALASYAKTKEAAKRHYAKKKDTLKSLKDEVESLTKEVAFRKKLNTTLRIEITAKNKEISGLKSQLTASTLLADIESLNIPGMALDMEA